MKKTLLFSFMALAGGAFAQTWNASSVSTTTTGQITGASLNLTSGGISLTGGISNINGGSSNIRIMDFVALPFPDYKFYIEDNDHFANGFGFVATSNKTGSQYGAYNNYTFQGTSGTKTGLYLNTVISSSSTCYGIRSIIQGGTGQVYGIYNKVNTGSGTRFGIYSEATGSNAKAGYFKGDLETYGRSIITGNGQSRFSFASSPTAFLSFSDQSLTISPNTTSGADDWNSNQSLQFFTSGILQKNTNTTGKAFSVYRSDLSRDVFKVNGDGKVYAIEINVQSTVFPDYVFKSDYPLMPLTEVKSYIEENGHLPNIPSEKEVMEEGINLSEMTVKLVEKVEELTLYVIDQQELLKKQQLEIEDLKKQLETQKN